jgi:hypothetical protein
MLSNHHVGLHRCTQALAFIELSVDNGNSQGFNVLLTVHHCVRNLRLWKNEATENGHMFQPVCVFYAVLIRAKVCCVHVCNCCIPACVVLTVSVNLQNLVKIKGVPWLFFSNVYYYTVFLALKQSVWERRQAGENACWRQRLSATTGLILDRGGFYDTLDI